ncbi:AB hydrolase-1 domain-containing protein [Fusarium sp. LHS14.1]|nr:AB hydrolase-1 domain-containing protein [Fusarium sp. LHS14.1]
MRIHAAVLSAPAASAMAKLNAQYDTHLTSLTSLVDPPAPLAQNARTEFVSLNGTKLAYRRFGKRGGNSVLYFNHLRAAMDVTDPLLFNYIAQYPEVILFDDIGVGHSEGEVSTSVEQMGDNAVALVNALDLDKPGIGPNATAGPPEVFTIASEEGEPTEKAMLTLFFETTETSLAAGRAWFKRRTDRRVKGEKLNGSVLEPGVTAQLKAISDFSTDPSNFGRLKDINIPVLVTNGKNDIMAPTINSFILQQELSNATLHVYPDSGHGHLFQFPKQYAQALQQFLDG